MKIQKELGHLDHLATVDVSVIRDKIETASREFLDAQYVDNFVYSDVTHMHILLYLPDNFIPHNTNPSNYIEILKIEV